MRDMSRFRRKKRLRVREVAAGVLGVFGAVLLAAEADEVAVRAVTALCGFALWGLAWVAWQGLERSCCLCVRAVHCLREALREEVEEGREKKGRAA